MKTAVVTGGASGIGRAIAQRLETDGHHVATIDLQPSEADFAYTADVTDREQVDAALGQDPHAARPGLDSGECRWAGRLLALRRHLLR